MGRRSDHNPDELCAMALETDPGEPVDYGEHAELTAVMDPVIDEIVGPDMARPARPQPDTRAVVGPETAPFGFGRRRSTESWTWN
jgi:hypothetical protein